MEILAVVGVMLALCAVVWVVSQPLRRGSQAIEEADSARVRDLEAAKEAKYQEIRDAELDYRTGKLSEGDWRVLDRTLRAEAVDLLKRLDSLEPLP